MGRYPNGDAGSLRTHILALMLRSLGASPFVIGLGAPTTEEVRSHEGIPYISLRSSGNSPVHRFFNYAEHADRLRQALRLIGKTDIFVCTHLPLPSIALLKATAERESAILIHDAVEWYSPSEYSLGRLSPQYQSKNFLNQTVIDKRFRVLAISRLLESHFRARGLRAARVPFVTDASVPQLPKRALSDRLRIIYAGTPGKKDELAGVVSASASLPASSDFELRILGASRESLLKAGVRVKDLDRLGDRVVIEPRKPRPEVLEAYSQADFSVLFRRAGDRYAMAGFPTKFTESLSTGTPLLLNISSDLGLYVEDGRNALVAHDHTPRSVLEVVERALDLSPEQRVRMSNDARRTVDERLDYHHYTDVLAELLE